VKVDLSDAKERTLFMKQVLCLSGILIGLVLTFLAESVAEAEALKLTSPTRTLPATWQGIYASRSSVMDSKQIAITAFDQGQFQQAHVLLQAWHEDHPEDLQVLYYLSQTSYKLNDFTLSKRCVDTLKWIAPQDTWTLKASQWAVNIPELQVDAKTLSQNNALLHTLKSVVDNHVPDLEFSSTLQESNEIPKATSTPRIPYVSPENSDALTTSQTRPMSELPTLAEGQIQSTPQTNPPTDSKTDAKIDPQAKPTLTETKTNTPVLTQDQIAQNFQMLQQLMMMQLMNQQNNNSMNPLMLQMMGQGNFNSSFNPLNTLGTSPSNQTMNPQIFSQMMQNSLLNNMNGLFNTNDTTNDSNSNGFGF
jgi:hypothetical protein